MLAPECLGKYHQEAQQQQQQEEQADAIGFQLQDADQQLLLAGLVGAGHGDVWDVAPVPQHHQQQQQQLHVSGGAHGNDSGSGLGWHSLQQLAELLLLCNVQSHLLHADWYSLCLLLLVLLLSQTHKLDDRALLRLCGSSSLQQLHLQQVHPWIVTANFLQQQLAPELPDIQVVTMEGKAVCHSTSSNSMVQDSTVVSGKQQQRGVSGKSRKGRLSAATAAGGANRGAGGGGAGAAAVGGGGSGALGVDGRSDVPNWKTVRRSSEGGDDSRKNSAGQGKLRVGSCPTAVAWERSLKLQDKELELGSRERRKGSIAVERMSAPLTCCI